MPYQVHNPNVTTLYSDIFGLSIYSIQTLLITTPRLKNILQLVFSIIRSLIAWKDQGRRKTFFVNSNCSLMTHDVQRSFLVNDNDS